MVKELKSCNLFLLLIGGVFLIAQLQAVPLLVVNNNNDASSNSVEVEDTEEETDTLIDDDITTHGLERLSSAATCLVAGVEYTHGQQIYRKDPCEFCLCLDGEMFCWWQDCPPTMEGPCRDRGPFSPCISIPTRPVTSSAGTSSTSQSLPTTTSTQANNIQQQPQQQQPSSKSTSNNIIINNLNSTSTSTSTDQAIGILSTDKSNEMDETDKTNSFSSEVPFSSTAIQSTTPKVCVIMGREYKIGDKLPHDTGNCIECVCGEGAKVTCSPYQCAPVGEDINDYRPPGPRQPDVF